jgi:beta-ureidopropionase
MIRPRFLTVLLAFTPALLPAADRVAHVVSISQEGLAPAQLVDGSFARLDAAAAASPALDIACLPEEFARGEPEAVPGPTTRRAAAWARQHHCYLICPLKVRVDGRIYQSAMLFDREGGAVGRYDKIHPTEKAIQHGVTPGPLVAPVFDTDFGRIGIQLCFDLNWRESWSGLIRQGAQIVFWPAAYAAAHQMPVLAFLNQCYVVTATMKSASRIYDITGDLITAGEPGHWWTAAALPLGKRLFELDYNGPKLERVEKTYGSRVRVNWLRDDDWITLEAVDPSLTVAGISREFGLTPLTDYIARAGPAQDAVRPSPAR